MREMRVLSPTAILGYGFPLASFEAGMARNPHVLAVDAGSTDPGPYYLGAGVSFTDRFAVKRDLELMLRAGRERKIPVIIGTAGGSGAKPHLEWNLEIIREIAREQGLKFRLAVIGSDLDKDFLLKELENGKLKVLPPGKPLERQDIEASTYIVGQMGVEPIIKALDSGAEVILAGRAYDPTVFAALAIKAGYDRGLALHMGKILECASIAALPGSGSDCMLGTLREDHFLLEPLNPERKCTTTSVAAHTLYEKTNPYSLPGPGGVIDLHQARFEQVSERVVKVSGSRFIPGDMYTVKIEGAKPIGFRTVSIAGARDPIFISNIDSILQGVRARVTDNFSHIPPESYYLQFHIYGRNGVMGDLEPDPVVKGHEVGIVIEAVAPAQDQANTICSFARSTLLHYGYPGRLSTAGNLAFLYSPSDFKAGAVFRFSIHHLVEVDDPCAPFPMELLEIQGGEL
ncbi:MAG: acyclic terpene utilization AtuA family protein [Clostridia bacterium]|nr:acyclic terpene utilization AtuA family protein [Clostridia bacterium]